MTKDERDELLEDANQIAYTAIKFSGLYKELTSAEWDCAAELFAAEIVEHLERRIEQWQPKESTNAR